MERYSKTPVGELGVLVPRVALLIFSLFAFLFSVSPVLADGSLTVIDHVAVIDMEMMILPGTQSFLEKSIQRAEKTGAKLLIVKLNTPGGILQTTQKMIQGVFQSDVPVVIYVAPTGATATSAGVFITMAGHVAAMAPGTSIGAAHPVAGSGEDIQGDMRKKAEEMTTALVKSITEQRGRNEEWVEKAVRESVSLTDSEALKQGVVDFVEPDIPQLLKKLKGKEIDLNGKQFTIEDYSSLPLQFYEIDFNDQAVNVLANPNIAAMLWLAATTGLSIELYNPGLIFPGMVGLICLILALAVSQIIPMSQGGMLLMLVGTMLIGAEFYLGTGILGVGGLVAVVIGAIYLVDVSQAPGMGVSPELIIPIGTVLAGYLFFVIQAVAKSRKQQGLTGSESLLGRKAEVLEPVSVGGKVFIDGEIWNATTESGLIEKGEMAEIVEVLPGAKLLIRVVESS